MAGLFFNSSNLVVERGFILRYRMARTNFLNNETELVIRSWSHYEMSLTRHKYFQMQIYLFENISLLMMY